MQTEAAMKQAFTNPNVARLTIADAARYLGVSVASIRRWTDAGDLACVRTPGKQRRFSVQELDRFWEEKKA